MKNQEAIKILGQYDVSNIHFYTTDGEEIPFTEWSDAIDMAISALKAQDLQPNLQQTCNQLATDTISRQAAIDALRYAQHRFTVADEAGGIGTVKWSEDVIYFAAAERILTELPSAQPDLSGYSDRLWKAAYERGKAEAQPERLTDDDFETIRIHLSAYKERLCNQYRWEEAEEYQRIIDRFMSFASAQPEIIRCKDCRHFEHDHPYIIQSVPVLGHEVCNAWGDGCKTDENGYCFLAERRTDDLQ